MFVNWPRVVDPSLAPRAWVQGQLSGYFMAVGEFMLFTEYLPRPPELSSSVPLLESRKCQSQVLWDVAFFQPVVVYAMVPCVSDSVLSPSCQQMAISVQGKKKPTFIDRFAMCLCIVPASPPSDPVGRDRC